MVAALLALTVAIAAAVAPTVVYVFVLWWLDRYEKEPVWLFTLAFVWGAVPGVIVSLVAELALRLPLPGSSDGALRLVESSIVAPLVEEGAKGVALLAIFLLCKAEFDDVLDGIIYGAVVGFGFAMSENVLYFVSVLLEDGVVSFGLLWLMRTVIFGLNHALFTAIFGVGLGLARLARLWWQRWLAPLAAAAMAVALHATHNLFTSLAVVSCWSALLSLLSDWGGLAVILAVIALSWRQERRWLEVHLAPEVQLGVITAEEYAVLGSSGRRLGRYWEALLREGWAAVESRRRRAAWATELAFRKHRQVALGPTASEAAAIDRLRALLRST